MADGKQPVLTGVIQTNDRDPKKRKILGRVALWTFEGKKGKEDSLFQN